MTIGKLIDAPAGAQFWYDGNVYAKDTTGSGPLDFRMQRLTGNSGWVDIRDAEVLSKLRPFDDDSFSVPHDRIAELSRWTLAMNECLDKRIAEGRQSKTENFYGFTLELFCDDGEPEWVIARLTGQSILTVTDVDCIAELIGSSDPRVDVVEAVRTATFDIQVELVMHQEDCPAWLVGDDE